MSDTKIKEYAEEMDVKIEKRPIYDKYGQVTSKKQSVKEKDDEIRWMIIAYNEGGYNQTRVDLLDVLAYVKENIPEIWPK